MTKVKGGKGGGGRKAAASGRGGKPEAPRRRGRPPRRDTQRTPPGERLIHRYGNRRFYDLAESRAVTLDQIAALARTQSVRVLDVEEGNRDITGRVLAQMIVDSERHLELLPVELLRHLLGAPERPTALWLRQFLSAAAALLDREGHTGAPGDVDVLAYMNGVYGGRAAGDRVTKRS